MILPDNTRKVYPAVAYALIISMIVSLLGPASQAAAAQPAEEQTLAPSGSSADLTFTKAVSTPTGKTRPEAGDILRYTLTLTNRGEDAQDVVIQDLLDPSLRLIPGSLEVTPLAYDQSLSTQEDTPLALTLTGWDGDGDSLTFIITEDPQHGSLTGSAPNLTYTPASDYFGADHFTFKVNDGSSDSQPAVVSIQVTVKNDPPVCSALSLTTAEDTPASLEPECTDAELDSMTYEIHTQPVHGSAAVESGKLTYTPEQDYFGSDSFSYLARDSYGASQAQTVTVTVTPVNDAPTANPQSLTTLEDQPLAITLSGEDVDGDPLSFTVTAEPLHGALSGVAPVLTYTPSPDYNGSDNFSFEICESGGSASLCDEATITLTVTAVNDQPSFIPGTDQTVQEDSGPLVIVGWAKDISAGAPDEAGQELRFQITANSAPELFSSGPEISPSGTLSFTPAPNANGSAVITYHLEDDGGVLNGGVDKTPSKSFSIQIEEINDAPQVQPKTFSLDENSPNGTLVGSVTFTDPDEGQSHTFAITGGNPNGAFTISPGNGEIRVAASSFLDFETTPTISLTVQVTDSGTPALSGSNTILINLNDLEETPSVNTMEFTVEENSLNGVLVGVVTARNLDAGQKHTFAIESGNTSGAFAIDAQSGVIRVANRTVLDYETHPIFSLVVSVSDDREPPNSSSTTVTVRLLDVNEAPLVEPGVFTLDENSTNGTLVGIVSFDDPDVGQIHTFAILEGDSEGAFSIASDGKITVADSEALDFETNPTFTLTVRVTDSGGLQGSASVIISLNDLNEAPHLNSDNFTLDENSPNGTQVGRVTFTDPDQGQSYRFAIIDGDPAGVFSIGPESGVITVAKFTGLNFEATPAFTLTVQVTDDGTPALSGSNTILVSLKDVNEAPTLDPVTLNIDENSPNGTTVGSLSFSDPDAGQSHSFTVISGSTVFSVDESSGEIRVANKDSLDFETQSSFTLQVRITDNGVPALSDTATITILVNDVEEAPIVGEDEYETIGNTLLEVSGGEAGPAPRVFVSGSLLENDSDPDGAGVLTASPASTTSHQGGVVNIAGDGSFTYLPPVGIEGTDWFTYTVTDKGGSTASGLVNITIRSMVWYVKNNAPAGGSGRSDSPFNTLAAAESASGNGSTIYIYQGSGSTGMDQGITLKDNQRLIGAGVPLEIPVQVNGGPATTRLLSAGAGQPQLTNLTPSVTVVTVSSSLNQEIRGLNLAGTGRAISVVTSSSSASIKIQDNTVSSTANVGIYVNANGPGTLNLDIRNNSVTAGGRGLDVRTNGNRTLNFQVSGNTLKAKGDYLAVNGSDTGVTRITEFNNNQFLVDSESTGSGILISNAIFDASPNSGYQKVEGGSLSIGDSNVRIGAAGMSLTNVRGELGFTDLSIHAGSGAALKVTSSGVFSSAGTGFRLAVASEKTNLTSDGGSALEVDTASLDLQKATLATSNSPGAGVYLKDAAGTLSVSEGSIKDAAGIAFHVTGGNVSIDYNGTVENRAGKSISVASFAGEVAFTGVITDTGAGISLANNSGRITFSGGLKLTTGSNEAFSAVQGGTLAVIGEDNTLSTTAAMALRIDRTTIGSEGLTFKSIEALNSPASTKGDYGIYLKDTGTLGGLKVTGDGSTGSGGKIQSTRLDCISLTGAKAVELNQMILEGCGAIGLNASQVNGLIFRGGQVLNAGDANEEHGIRLSQVYGQVLIQDTEVRNACEDGILLQNSSGVLNMTLQRTTISTNNETYGEDGFQFRLSSSAQAAILVDDSTFTLLKRDGIDGVVEGNSSLDLTINNTNAFLYNKGSGGVNLSSSGSAVLRLNLFLNTFQNHLDTPINLVSLGGSTLDAVVAGNLLSPDATAADGYGIRLAQEDSSRLTVKVAGNNIQKPFLNGLFAQASGTGELHLDVRANTITAPSRSLPGAVITSTASANTLCLDIGHAAEVGGNAIQGGGDTTGIKLFKGEGSTFLIEGWNKTIYPTPDGHIRAYNPTSAVLLSGEDFTAAAEGYCREPDAAVLPQAVAGQQELVLSSADQPSPTMTEAQQAGLFSMNAAGQDNLDTLRLEIPLLPAGKSLTAVFEARILDPLPEGVQSISNQASLTSRSFSGELLSDDPATPAPQDATVTLLYRPPIAVDDAFTTPEDTPLEVAPAGVLANDKAAADYQDLLTAIKVSDPTSGSLDFRSDGSFKFTPELNFNGLVQFTYRANDTRSNSAPASVSILVSGVNDPPVLDERLSFSLSPVPAEAPDNPGTLVAALIASAGGDAITDVDPGALEGIAVTGVDNSRGNWQYSIDGGATWRDIGAPSPSAARLLAADAGTRIRLVPDQKGRGRWDRAFSFRAWDRTAGVNGGTLDLNNPAVRSAFSSEEAYASITITGNSDLSLSMSVPPGPLLAGAEVEYSLMVSNAGPEEATNLLITDQLPAGLSFVSASPGCQASMGAVNCSLASLGVGKSARFTIRVAVGPSFRGDLEKRAEVVSDQFDPSADDNQARAVVEIVPRLRAYSLGANPGKEWNRPTIATSPSGARLLGEYGEETITLTLEDLPPHTRVLVAFDLYILRSWDGNQTEWPGEIVGGTYRVAPEEIVGPDRWRLEVDGVTLLDTTFSNWSGLGFLQAYPENYPQGSYPAQTGAAQVGALGYGKQDATYHLSYEIDHSASSLLLKFSGSGLQDLADESWGLGNVRVTLSAGAALQPHTLFIPIISW